MSAYDKAKADNMKNPAKHVENLQMRGWYRCCLYKWKRARTAQKWPLLCKAAPQLARKFKEVPDVLRSFMNMKCKFRARKASVAENSSALIPSELMSVVADTVVSFTVTSTFFL